jgi:membrane peptidoglycan carboxypeptidase
VQRGTARAISDLAPYVAGKTGTSEDENDAWFVGFTNDVTVAVWVGYDNGDGKRRTLGAGSTGAHIALPIFEPIIEATWAQGRPKTPLNPPSPQARRLLVAAEAEQARHGRSRSRVLLEYFRKDAYGEPVDARYALLSRRGEGRTARARSRSVEPPVWRWDQPAEAVGRNANDGSGRGFFDFNHPGTAPGQPANSWGASRSMPQQWRGRSYPNGGFFGFPYGR